MKNKDNIYYQECLSSCPEGYKPESITNQCIIMPETKNEICNVKYKGTCYLECPKGTCLTQNDPELRTCIEFKSTMKIFNNICFDNFNEITNNIKSLSESGETISTNS